MQQRFDFLWETPLVINTMTASWEWKHLLEGIMENMEGVGFLKECWSVLVLWSRQRCGKKYYLPELPVSAEDTVVLTVT